MKLSSHNTMTYLQPKKWWMKIFKPIYQCQNKTIQQQLDIGVRFLDIRISFDNLGIPEFRHGLVAFKEDVTQLFKFLNEIGDVVCRIVLEKVSRNIDYALFQLFCIELENKYSNIIFTCGEYKKTKKIIYDFKNSVPVTEMYGSVCGRGLEKIFPKLYSNKNNENLLQKYQDVNYLMIDFV